MVILMIKDDISTILGNLKSLSCKGKTVLITGGAGFLGSWLCEALLEQDARVLCFDNFASGLESNISAFNKHKNFKFFRQDVSETLHCPEKVDLAFHLASRASPFEFEKYPLEILKANTVGIVNTLEVARIHGARFIFTSTSETYGNPAVVPTPESYFGNVNSVGVRGCYDESKRCGEAYVVAYLKQYNLDVRIARIFNTYGPRMRGDDIYGRVIPRFIAQAVNNEPITVFGDGTQTRSFCYVTDQIEGILRLATIDEARGQIINIGNDEEIQILKLASIIKDLTGSRSQIVFEPLPQDDPARRRPDLTRAKQILNWKPKVNTKQGLAATIEWNQFR